jgi:hypothetical protein
MRVRKCLYNFVLFLLLVSLFTGCAIGPYPMVRLQTDNHSNEMYKAIVYGRVVIRCDTEELNENYLEIHFVRNDVEPSPTKLMSLSWFIADKSRERGHVGKLFAVEVVPGVYELKWIKIGPRYEGTYSFFPNQHDYSKPQHIFTVEPNSLTYLGTIEINIDSFMYLGKTRFSILDAGLKVVQKKDGFYKYNYTTDFVNNLASDSILLKDAFPSLYEKYKDNTKLAN